MTRCPICAAEVPQTSRFCLNCGAALDASAVPTVAMARKPPSSSTADEGRFPAGTMLGERYKIIGLLGRGGMGEVYRAADLKLEQQVALKFLPPQNTQLLERFRSEVRIARQVSHRNVCRVYDLGEIGGAPFISMEYVDGEDLGSLLRRIGRLPGDKALEFSRRLCAGLAAAHEKGVLHRDLKPANIMIDGRGQVLIMDFGLAAAADAVAGGDIRSGTPAYMAPEQKGGREVTVRSDIYSLGLVMQEMFLGRDSTSSPKDLDPAVEKVIQRCLDANPSKRPQSALDLARALPGGDPLAEALAAGDTPSPEMVAASDDTGTLSVGAAVACMIFVIVGMAALVFWGSRSYIINLTPMPYSPDVLTQKSHEIALRFGYTTPPADEIHGFTADPYFSAWAGPNLNPEAYRAQIAQGQPSVLFFYHLQSPQYMVLDLSGLAGPGFSPTNPQRIPGSIDIWLDPQGRLILFKAVAQRETSPSAGPIEWNKLFEAAKLDASRWTPLDPREVPQVAFDTRAAWTGTYPGWPNMPMRIEAAAWQGRPVYFEIFGPWGPAVLPPDILLVPIIFLLAVLGGLLFALRNLRTGRGDIAGAGRLAAFVLLSSFIGSVLFLHHTPTIGEVGALLLRLALSLLVAAVVWALYMALEPYVRRRWPQVLIGWTRALSGNFRDPLVAGHVLAGIAAGIGIGLIEPLALAFRFRFAPQLSTAWSLQPVGTIANWFDDASIPLALTLGGFFLFVLLRLLLRRTSLAAMAVIAIIGAITFNAGGWVAASVAVVETAIFMNVAIRFGMLAFAIALIVEGIPGRYPLTANFSAWFATAGWMEVALVLGVSLWCFRNALGGRKVWKRDFLES